VRLRRVPTLSFDLGGTHLRCGIARGDELAAVSVEKVRNFISGLKPEEVAEGVADRIIAYVDDHTAGIAGSDPLALAFPGPIGRGNIALSAPTLYGPGCIEVPDLAALLGRRTGRPVFMLNDVSATAWALARRTAAARFMVVTVSSGIGSKIFDRDCRRGVLDACAYAGEIGHFVVDEDPEAPVCDCGGRGHLGAIASGRGVERAVRRRHGAHLDNAAHIVPAIRRGEGWALAALSDSIAPLARTLLAVTLAVGLEKVFIVGGFAQSIGALYAERLNAALTAQSRYPIAERALASLCEVVGAHEELGLLGAAYYAQRSPAHA
jgi:predicted NBD/HSP70 family sugar kinase